MTRFRKLFFAVCALFFLCVRGVFAALVPISEDGSLSIDFPEGFSLIDVGTDGQSMQLQNSVVPVSAVVRLYDTGVYGSPAEALTDSLSRLHARGDTDSFTWRNHACALSSFTNAIGGAYSGYAAAAELPKEEGLVVLIVWTANRDYEKYGNFMLSLIDALNIDFGSRYEPGLVTSYVYPDTGRAVPLSLAIGDVRVASELRETDKEASGYLIEREYGVLLFYQRNGLWKEAWQRYYRMIYRDSFRRLQKSSFDIFNALAPLCVDETDLAQRLLSWTQDFAYEREKTASDFASLPSILLGGGSDCDSRSMLLAVLLNQMNMDVIIFVSNAYSHAVAGLVSSHPGYSFGVEGRDYLPGETTAKGATWGMISKEQDDQGNWIPVVFP